MFHQNVTIFLAKMTDFSLVTHAGRLQSFSLLKPCPTTIDFKLAFILSATQNPINIQWLKQSLHPNFFFSSTIC